jgi:type III restriction enzyme
VTIADGSPARLALYFPQVDDLRELRPHVELALSHAGLPTTVVLENHSASSKAEIDAFNRLNDPTSPHRVILLVNKGTEGWNCPSLFATALARKLRTANNFVLQAASRCLRQVPGNTRPARIYLSDANRGILDRQLRETYGESLDQLNERRRRTATAVITLRKTEIDPIPLRRKRRVLVREDAPSSALAFTPPSIAAGVAAVSIFDVGISAASRRVLRQVGETVALEIGVDTVDVYAAAQPLSANYRADQWAVLDPIRSAYPDGSVPVAHLDGLARQLEEHSGGYRQAETDEETPIEIVKPQGWDEREVDGVNVHAADISYPIDKQHLVIGREQIADNSAGYGFHYTPYNFDSNPEADFFEHRPASARVELERPADGRAKVVIRDFMSPSIIERLRGQEGVLSPQVDDWRAMVDSVVIDTAYDGEALDIAVADIPERKADLVAGAYEFALPPDSTAVAVRITDMLGEDVLVILPVSH